MEFLGNKTSMLPTIIAAVARLAPPGAAVADVFTGTASVATALRREGYRVHANDHLPLCVEWAKARLLAPEKPLFRGLADELGQAYGDDRLDAAVAALEASPPRDGFLTRHYSPASIGHDGVERRYLTVENARRADGIRAVIATWQPYLTAPEHALLLASLVSAIVNVSNVAGTYGCFLKNWKPRALAPLRLVPVRPGAGAHDVGHRVSAVDAEVAAAETDAEVLYADPPYTKRQYAAYYHLLNTVVMGSEPSLTGSTGLPRWQEWQSDWCYARRAPEALDRLIAKASSPAILLSYNDDGQIPHDVVMDILTAHGAVEVDELDRRRYKSSQRPHRGSLVTERLYCVRR